MPPFPLPLRWESTEDQWWYVSPIDCAAANGHYDLVKELISLDTNLLIKLTSLHRIRRLETVWDEEDQFNDVAKCRFRVARNLFLDCEPNRTGKGQNSLIRAGYGGWLLYTACSAGDMAFVRKLLKMDPTLVLGEGEYGVTDILYAAARSKNSKVFRLLLEFSSSQRLFHVKLEESYYVFRSKMINRGVHAAARGGNVEILREIIGDNLSDILSYRDSNGSTVMHSASGRGQVEVVKDLLATYDIITSTDNQGNTALHVAAYYGHLAVVKVLINASNSITSIANNNGDTFLHMVIAGFQASGFRRVDRQIKLIKELVSGTLVNIENFVNNQNNKGRTALHMAVNEKIKSEVVELLMSVSRINLNSPDNDGMTPLDLLKKGSRSASSNILIKLFLSAGGTSTCDFDDTSNSLVSHLKTTGIQGSPGTSFRVPDSEIFLYDGETETIPFDCDVPSTDYKAYSADLSRLSSPDINSFGIDKPSSIDNAKIRLKRIFRWPGREGRNESLISIRDDDSLKSFRINNGLESSSMSLRDRFSKQMLLSNSKGVSAVRDPLPSPSPKKKFPSPLTRGAIQTVPNSPHNPSSPISNTSRFSPKQIGGILGKEIEESPISKLSFSIENCRVHHKIALFDKKMMNRYSCFGSQSLDLEDSHVYDRPHRSHKRSSSLIT